jgi:hypothetical protein
MERCENPLKWTLVWLALGALLQPTLGWSYSPESPEVRAMIKRAIPYLEKASNEELGGDCLIALTLVKEGIGENHPVVAHAVKRVKEGIAANQITDKGSDAFYSTGIAGIFMCEVDPVKYRREIDFILQYTQKRQMNTGGWSYPSYATGDTSQTQYAVLFLWTAQHSGISIAPEMVERAAAWLMRTQDPGGGWGYQGAEPVMGQRAGQSVTLSMAAAGLSSLYICGDIANMGAQGPAQRETGLPPALRLIVPESDRPKQQQPSKVKLDQAAYRRSIGEGDQFFAKNFNILNRTGGGGVTYQFYYMYALERYQSFRELSIGSDDPEPDWYNQGVDYLMKNQNADGSFGSGSALKPEIDTCFAVLFLTRSTKKAIAKNVSGDGMLSGGKGLAGKMANARVKDGKIIAPPEKGAVDDLMSILDNPNSAEVDALAEFPDGWLSDLTPEKLAKQLDRLRRVVYAPRYEARIVAVRAIGRSGDYDSVPHLIYALTDPDFRVVRAANDGLRYISRKLDGFTLPEKYTEQDRQGLIKRWKDWYRSVNPTAIFLD